MATTPKTQGSGAIRDHNPASPVVVRLSKLALDALVGEGPTDSGRAASRLEGAIRCYLSDKDAGRSAWPYPAFLRGSEVQEDVRIELGVDRGLWSSFEAEAARQDVSAQQLCEHAAFYLAAELDAGHITQRILDDLESSESEDSAA